MTPRLLAIARHGHSRLNAAGVVNGDPARDEGLSERGIEEARRLGRQLAGVSVDAVVVSPFPRARQTARIALGDRDLEPIVDPQLGDVRIGELEGATLDAYRASRPHADRRMRFPGGESLDEAALRYAEAFERLLAVAGATIVVVTHEIPLRYAINAAAGGDRLDGPIHDIANATPYLFDDDAMRRASARIAELASAAPGSVTRAR